MVSIIKEKTIDRNKPTPNMAQISLIHLYFQKCLSIYFTTGVWEKIHHHMTSFMVLTYQFDRSHINNGDLTWQSMT